MTTTVQDAVPSNEPAPVPAPRRPRWRDTWSILKETATDWSDDDASRLAAALACYTLLSIAPLVVLSISVVGLVFGEDAARGQISRELGGLVGGQAAGAVEQIVLNAKKPESGIANAVIGIVILLAGASGVFAELQAALNAIWEVKAKPGEGVRAFIRHRFFSFAMVLAVAFLLLVSLVLSATISAVGTFFQEYLPGGEVLWQLVNLAASLAVTTVLFALIFKVIPDVDVRWKDVWVGGFLTALLFAIGKFLLGFYIGKSGVTSSFGVAGSLVALVIWVYYSSQILFLGAEFTQVYARRYGGHIRPSPHAVKTST